MNWSQAEGTLVGALAGTPNPDIAKQLLSFAKKQLGEIERLLRLVEETRHEAKEANVFVASSDVQIKSLEADVKSLCADLRVVRGVKHHDCHDASCPIFQFLNKE